MTGAAGDGEGCPAHPADPAVAVCASCDRALCEDCWKTDVAGEAWCSPCVALLMRPVSPLVPVGLAVLVLVVAAAFVLRAALEPAVRWAALGGGAAVVALVAWRVTVRAERRRRAQVISPRRELPGGRPSPRRGLEHHPFRGTLRRISRRVAPPVSGVAAVSVVGAALVVAAAALPAVLALPRWIELEAVVVAWWAILAATLATLLFRGQRVARDAAVAPPGPSRDDGWTLPDVGGSGCGDLDGLAVVVGAVLALLLGFVLIELALPALLLGVYLILVAALRRVANDRHRCAGDLARAVAWGALWATLYTAPLAALVYAVHRVS